LHLIAGCAWEFHKRDQHLSTVRARFDPADRFRDRRGQVFGGRGGREATGKENRHIVLTVRLDIMGELHQELYDDLLLLVLLRNHCLSALRSSGDLGHEQVGGGF